MKYRLKVYYQTEATEQVTKYMQQIMGDWRESNKELEICRTWDFELPTPLTEDKRQQILQLKAEGIRAVELEEIEE